MLTPSWLPVIQWDGFPGVEDWFVSQDLTHYTCWWTRSDLFWRRGGVRVSWHWSPSMLGWSPAPFVYCFLPLCHHFVWVSLYFFNSLSSPCFLLPLLTAALFSKHRLPSPTHFYVLIGLDKVLGSPLLYYSRDLSGWPAQNMHVHSPVTVHHLFYGP